MGEPPSSRRSAVVRVPLALRLLFARPVRTVSAVLAIGLALMLMLILNGLWSGVQQRVTTYEDHLGADLVVVPAGTETLFGEPGVIQAATLAAVRGTPGVEQASPVRTMYLILELSDGKAAVAAVASEPSRPGGPWSLARGRPPSGTQEVAVDRIFADQHHLGLGDQLPMLGHQMRIVGLTNDTAMFMTPLVFTTNDAMNTMLRVRRTAGAILVNTQDPEGVAAALRARGLAVRTPAQLHEAALRLATRIFGSPMRLMVAVAFAAGTLIVALVANSRLAEQQRDLGILKALGSTPRRVRRIAVAETIALAALGAGASVVLMVLAQEVLAWWRPAFPVVLTPRTLAATATAAVAMALLAAWLPARRLARLDAATAFRSPR